MLEMVAGGVVVLLLSAIGVNLYGWSNLADELLCGLVVLISYLIGACAHPKREGGASLGGAFGADFSWLGILFWAPAALAAGLVIGAVLPPWSVTELAIIVVACVCALKKGYDVARL